MRGTRIPGPREPTGWQNEVVKQSSRIEAVLIGTPGSKLAAEFPTILLAEVSAREFRSVVTPKR